MEGLKVVGIFVTFSVKTNTPFLKDACTFVLPFRICRLLKGLHAKEKYVCDQLADGCAQICVCLFVDVEDELFWCSFLMFFCWVHTFLAP